MDPASIALTNSFLEHDLRSQAETLYVNPPEALKTAYTGQALTVILSKMSGYPKSTVPRARCIFVLKTICPFPLLVVAPSP